MFVFIGLIDECSVGVLVVFDWCDDDMVLFEWLVCVVECVVCYCLVGVDNC